MNLTEKQKEQVFNIIEKAKMAEYKSFNSIIENAVNEWKTGVKDDKQAYDKIYKKVVKNEHHLAHRYADLDNQKAIKTIAEIFSDDIVNIDYFMRLDADLKKEVYSITGIKIS